MAILDRLADLARRLERHLRDPAAHGSAWVFYDDVVVNMTSATAFSFLTRSASAPIALEPRSVVLSVRGLARRPDGVTIADTGLTGAFAVAPGGAVPDVWLIAARRM